MGGCDLLGPFLQSTGGPRGDGIQVTPEVRGESGTRVQWMAEVRSQIWSRQSRTKNHKKITFLGGYGGPSCVPGFTGDCQE